MRTFFCLSLFFLGLTAEAGHLPYNPTYLVQHGAKFGGRQDDYLKRAEEIIERSVQNIQEAVGQKRDLHDLFFQILDRMASERRQIAEDHQTQPAIEFGARRDENPSAHVIHTPMVGKYVEYRRRILGRIRDVLVRMKRREGRFIQKTYSVTDRAFGRRSCMAIEVFEPEDVQREAWLINPPEKHLPSWYPTKLCRQEIRTEENDRKIFLATQRLWKEVPHRYQWFNRGYSLHTLQEFFPIYTEPGKERTPRQWIEALVFHRSVFVEATIFFEIGGKMSPLYRYFTWLYRDVANPQENLFRRMMSDSLPIVQHQSQFVVKETLDDLATVFEKIVLWDRRDLAELKQLVALFRYEMGCTPFHRGSAAIIEWFEAAFYRYHQIDYQVGESRYVDLEVYCNPFFSDFYKAYDAICLLSLPAEPPAPRMAPSMGVPGLAGIGWVSRCK